MKLVLRPLTPGDAAHVRVPLDCEGVATLDDVDEDASLLSLYPTLFHATPGMRGVDRHGAVFPLHWPLYLVRLLQAAEDVVVLAVVHTREFAKDAHEDELRVVVQRMHLFQTPSYAPVMKWLCREDASLKVGDRMMERVDARTVRDDLGVTRSLCDWMQRFPVEERDLLDLVVTHRRRGYVLAKDPDGATLFCLRADVEDERPSPEAAPYKKIRV